MQFNAIKIKFLSEVSQSSVATLSKQILHYHQYSTSTFSPWTTGIGRITTTVTYKSVIEADIAFQLCPSMLKLDYWNFCCSDR